MTTLTRRTRTTIPAALRQRIDDALAEVAAARSALAGLAHAGLAERRAAHARLRHAYLDADRALREATTLARPDRWEWMQWRRRLSVLDTARQRHLFAEQDASCVLPDCTVQTLDTGMSGPAIGELQHGEAALPGAVPAYGVDMDDYCLHAGAGACC